MTDIAAAVPAQPLPRPSEADVAAPAAVQAEIVPAPARRTRFQRLAATLAETHRAAVPF